MSYERVFEGICNCAAARNCYNGGQSVEQIAKSAKKSKSTVYRWLRVTKHLQGAEPRL